MARLARLQVTDGDNTEAFPTIEEAQRSHQIIRSGVRRHCMVPTVLGARALSLLHKVQAASHSIWLETGSVSAFIGYVSSVMCFTTDGGTESGMAQLTGVDLQKLFPKWVSALHIFSDNGGMNEDCHI